MVDAHVSFSNTYSYDELVSYIQEAVKKNIDELIVLEPTYKFHECAPLYKEVRAVYPYQEAWYASIDKCSIIDYQKFIIEMRKKEFPIQVKFGLDITYFTQHEWFIQQMMKAFPYDTCVGHVTFIDNVAIAWEEYSYEMLWSKYNVNFLYRRYYEMMYSLITSDLFDGVSGFDNIKLSKYKQGYKLSHTYHKLCSLLIKHKLYVENDTSVHYRSGSEDIGLHSEFVAVCKEFNVPILNASNAHSSKEIGKLFTQVK